MRCNLAKKNKALPAKTEGTLQPGELVLWDKERDGDLLTCRVASIYPVNALATPENRLPQIEWSNVNAKIVIIFTSGYRGTGDDVYPKSAEETPK
jgi:hypothetical protein